jgi:adenosine deaminase
MADSVNVFLDDNNFYQVTLNYDKHSKELSGSVSSLNIPSAKSSFIQNIIPLISINSEETAFKPRHNNFVLRNLNGSQKYSLELNGQKFVEFYLNDNGIELEGASGRKLAVFETRMIGRAKQTDAPYPLGDVMSSIKMPITDLHTHLSGQLLGKDLIDIGLQHNIPYPTSALDKLGIDYPKENLISIPKKVFLPWAHLENSNDKTESAVPLAALSAQARDQLSYALGLSPERQSTFKSIEMCYYLREPFTKNLDILPDVLRKVAGEYNKQGIKYAELSSNAVIEPQWMNHIHKHLPQIEKETGVSIRFLAGMPRNLSEGVFAARIEMIKHVSSSPYFAGVDILGFEMNKTSYLQKQIGHLAEWMQNERPEAILRIHAGENSKNSLNVYEALEFGDKYNIRLRVGHNLYGIDENTVNLAIRVAQKGELINEFLPDSNLACNNIDYPGEVPILKFIHNSIPSVISSDGSGMYQTTSKQTVAAALFTGVTPAGFEFMRSVEEKYIERQMKIFNSKELIDIPDKKMPVAPKVVTTYSATPDHKLPASELISQKIGNKFPMFIFGAAGSSWDLIKNKHKTETIISLKMLTEYLDPNRVCFITGRTKSKGVGVELGKIIAEQGAADKKFDYFKILAENADPTVRKTDLGITEKLSLSVPLAFLPGEVIESVKHNKGYAIYYGGKTFTRDFITESHAEGLQFCLFDGPAGASTQKARIYPEHAAKDPIEVLKMLNETHHLLFKKPFDEQEAAKLYQQYKTEMLDQKQL